MLSDRKLFLAFGIGPIRVLPVCLGQVDEQGALTRIQCSFMVAFIFNGANQQFNPSKTPHNVYPKCSAVSSDCFANKLTTFRAGLMRIAWLVSSKVESVINTEWSQNSYVDLEKLFFLGNQSRHARSSKCYFLHEKSTFCSRMCF